MKRNFKIRSFLAAGCLPAILVLISLPFHRAWPDGGDKTQSEYLTFVREFSSAEDVKGVSHPILNKSLDIIAGPKEEVKATDVLQTPYSITTDSDHRIFVTDLKDGVVHVFDFEHSKYSLLHGGDPLRMPMGIAADRNGNVYVSDSGAGSVAVYDPRGRFSHFLTKESGRESYFETPRGIAVDPATQHIYVCDTTRHMIIALEKTGRVLARFGTRGGGNGPGEFRRPTQIAATPDQLVVLDTGNSRLQVLDVQGHFKTDIKLADVSNQSGLAVDNTGNIYVSDPQLNHVQIFARDGKLLHQFGEAGNGPGQFNGVSGLWVDSGQCLYTVDSHNKRVQLFRIHRGRMGAC